MMSWLSLFLFLIMLGIMFFQTIHGLFSAMIMAVVCVLSATLALGAHEVLAEDVLLDMIGNYAYPVAYVGIFAVSVFVLRMILDKIVARNTLIPALIDKGGSAAFGMITGLVATGVLGIGIQMLPAGPTILGFQRFDEQGKPHHELWLKPDAFTVNLCGYLTDYTLGGQAGWHANHPDFLTELHWLRNTTSLGSRMSTDAGSVSIAGKMWTTDVLYKFKRGKGRNTPDTYDSPGSPPAGMRWLGVSVQVDKGGADSDGRFRFSPSQIRIVGETVDGRTRQYMLKGLGPYDDLYVFASSQPLWGGEVGKFDFVFEVPEGFQPRFMEFKRSGRAMLPKNLGGAKLESRTPTNVPAQVSSAAGGSPASGGRSGRRGSTTPVRPLKRDTHFGNKMPMSIQRYVGTAVESAGAALKSGHLALYVDSQAQQEGRRSGGRSRVDPPGTTLDSFDVPPGLHLLQLNVEALHATTTLGGALNLTRRVLQQYRVIDKGGERYWPAGLIAECDSGGQRVMEIQYFPEEVEQLDRSQLRPFQRMKFKDLTGDYRFVLLFVLPRGAEIVTFDSGGKPVDLSDMKLVAGG